MNYFNSTQLDGDALQDAIVSAEHQDAAVLAIYRGATGPLSPSQVWEAGQRAGLLWLLTSVRRSINTLTRDGLLARMQTKRTGLYGRAEFIWTLATAGHTAPHVHPASVNVEAA